MNLEAWTPAHAQHHNYVWAAMIALHAKLTASHALGRLAQATGIREMLRAHPHSSLGQLLRLIAEETLKSCDPDERECCHQASPGHCTLPPLLPPRPTGPTLDFMLPCCCNLPVMWGV